MRTLFVISDLRAKEAARERMVWIARNSHCSTALYGNEHRARIGAVVWASSSDDSQAAFGVSVVIGRCYHFEFLHLMVREELLIGSSLADKHRAYLLIESRSVDRFEDSDHLILTSLQRGDCSAIPSSEPFQRFPTEAVETADVATVLGRTPR